MAGNAFSVVSGQASSDAVTPGDGIAANRDTDHQRQNREEEVFHGVSSIEISVSMLVQSECDGENVQTSLLAEYSRLTIKSDKYFR